MRSNKVLYTLLMISSTALLHAQNVDYSDLEKRFVKKELTARDTVAFREVGEQKVMQLFDKSNFYSQNYSNTSNQIYVKQQIPDLFYVPQGDTLDVDGLLFSIEKAKYTQSEAIELLTVPVTGYLGKVETLNCEPKFTFHLVLMQIPKKFGKEQEMVWQVFLHNPEIQEMKQKKTLKKSK